MNYWAWITLVQNAIADLDLSATEELDLQSRCLGKESTEQVRRIKTVIIRNPPTGLFIVWERLGGIYRSPEAVEQTLFNKLENFPKVTTKDPQKLKRFSRPVTRAISHRRRWLPCRLGHLQRSKSYHREAPT